MNTNITISIELPHTSGLKAIITMERIGQEEPVKGDNVFVEGALSLPCGASGFLVADLVFGYRIRLMDEHLRRDWGGLDNGGLNRLRVSTHSATRWHIAFADAEKYLRAELQKLLDALEARHAALIQAEEEDF